MVNRPVSTDVNLRKMIRQMKKSRRPLWRRVALELSKPSRQRVVVNLYKINKYTQAGQIALVPGKVLGIGKLDHAVTIAALSFSKSAVKKILEAKGEAVRLDEALSKVTDFSSVRLLK